MATERTDWRLLLAGLRHWCGLVGSASPGARVVELEGVYATVVPAVAQRSVFNSVTFDDAGRLEAALPALRDAYEQAGVEAWTVWVPEGDPAGPMLQAAGHRLDAAPAGMLRDLAGARRPEGGALDGWAADGDLRVAAAINDRSFPFGDDSFSRGLAGLDTSAVHVYVGTLAGEAVIAAVVCDHGTNAEVDCVAVLPEARGRGLSGELLGHALADAHERGLETTTLVATSLGRPIYERLGYRSIGPIEMWESRADTRAPR